MINENITINDTMSTEVISKSITRENGRNMNNNMRMILCTDEKYNIP